MLPSDIGGEVGLVPSAHGAAMCIPTRCFRNQSCPVLVLISAENNFIPQESCYSLKLYGCGHREMLQSRDMDVLLLNSHPELLHGETW